MIEDLDISYKPKAFCRVESLSPSTYRKLKLLGLGPRTYHIPGTTIERITAEARREWQQMMAKLTVEQAAEIELARKVRSERSAALGKLAVLSPRHPQHKNMRKRRKVVR